MNYQDGDIVKMTFCETLGDKPIIHSVTRGRITEAPPERWEDDDTENSHLGKIRKPKYFVDPAAEQTDMDEAARITRSLAESQRRRQAQKKVPVYGKWASAQIQKINGGQ